MRRTLTLLDLLLFAALTILLFCWLMGSLRFQLGVLEVSISWGWRPIVAPIVLFFLRCIVARRYGLQAGPLFKAAFGLAVSITLLFAVEALLAAAGFEKEYARIYISADPNDPANAEKAIIDDRDLLWRFKPNAMFRGREINALGFLGRAVQREKPQHVKRVLCLGDSCTAEGQPPYTDVLHELLNRHDPGKWEAFNMGVHGYSIVQGRKLFAMEGASFSPDYVTLYFGWNDHWLDHYPDSARMMHERHRTASKIYRKLLEKRLFQFLVHVTDGMRTQEERVIRVPQEEYVRELEACLRAIQRAGAQPILLTAPRAEKLTKHLVKNGNARSVEEAIELHDVYVELTRNVAARHDLPLIDLAEKMDKANDFRRDGVHLEQEGLITVAQAIAEELLSQMR